MTGHDAEGAARMRCAENAAMLAARLGDLPQTVALFEVIAHAAVAIAAVEAEAEGATIRGFWAEPADFAFDEVSDVIREAVEEFGGLSDRQLGALRARVQGIVAPYLRGVAS